MSEPEVVRVPRALTLVMAASVPPHRQVTDWVELLRYHKARLRGYESQMASWSAVGALAAALGEDPEPLPLPRLAALEAQLCRALWATSTEDRDRLRPVLAASAADPTRERLRALARVALEVVDLRDAGALSAHAAARLLFYVDPVRTARLEDWRKVISQEAEPVSGLRDRLPGLAPLWWRRAGPGARAALDVLEIG